MRKSIRDAGRPHPRRMASIGIIRIAHTAGYNPPSVPTTVLNNDGEQPITPAPRTGAVVRGTRR